MRWCDSVRDEPCVRARTYQEQPENGDSSEAGANDARTDDCLSELDADPLHEAAKAPITPTADGVRLE